MNVEHKLDLYNFDSIGEIIVSGDGPKPDDEITRQVAKMYDCDGEVRRTPTEIEAEIARRMLDRSSP